MLVPHKSIVLEQLNGVAPRNRDGADCVIRKACVLQIIQSEISVQCSVNRAVESSNVSSALGVSKSCDCSSRGWVKVIQGKDADWMFCLRDG